jgi:hypothetical protein
MITQPIVESNSVRLFGNVRPEAIAANDRGRVPDNLPMEHLLLQLKRPPAREQALQSLIDQLHDPRSPNYHHWLSASEIGAQFGPAASDIRTISLWLQQHGFTINTVYSNRMVIDYSGTAGQVRTAFHTDIHYLDVNGVTRFANMTDPAIPAALAPAVVGVTSLNDIPPKPMLRPAPKPQYTPSGYVCGAGFMFQCYLLTPPDVATIYNFNPLFAAGNTGQGQTIYLIEASNLFANNDWTTFRSTFGIPVSSYPGASLTTINPGGCANSTNSYDGEAILDAEYASAAAPSAAIVIASCENLLLAIQTLVNSASPPAIMSISYGQCEATNGAVNNQAYSTAYQTGVAEGMSIFVSAGDGGAAGCDNPKTATDATLGIAVSGLASTPYNVAVGGTDFSDSYNGTNSTYWNSNESAPYGSALSYIPEIPWNSSCGSQLFASYLEFAATYGTAGLCNSSTASMDTLLNISAGSGGPSSCATGSSATCMGWPKPSWQSGLVGNPADGVRDLPDVSLFSGGDWGHFYIYCWSDTNNGGKPCTDAPINWSGGGGTSFAAPIWAGIQALVNQQAGGAAQGNPNFRLYALAAMEYTPGVITSCNANNGNTVGSSCIFYDVTLGDTDVPCQSGSPNCYDPSGTYGVLSTSTGSYAPAFDAQTGWDFATGIGTVNVYNLVTNWSNTGPSQALQVAPTTNIAASGTQGGPFTPASFSYTLSATSGSVNFSISGVPSWLSPSVTSGTASSGTTVTFTVNASANSLPANTYPATITFTNSGTGQGTQTRTATLTVNPPGLQVTPTTNIAASGQQGGPFSPSLFSYSISAAAGSLKYSITNVPSWLTVSPTSGTVTTKATTVTFKINTSAADKLSAGTVTTINFNNTTNNQGNTTRVATLTVTPKEYTIKVSASPNADGTVSGGGTFVQGASETVTATPNSGRTFVHWTENGKVVSTSASYTFTVSANATLVADFATLKEYTVKVSASPSADGTAGGGGTFVQGTSETVTATPNSGHTFVQWTENGKVVSTSASYTFTLNSNVTLIADFQ